MERAPHDSASTVRRPAAGSASAPNIPRSLGDYRLLRLLGEGGMGAVYLGYDEANDRQVAIKVLADQLAGNPSYVERFNREARSGSVLQHPNLVRCYGTGRDRNSGKYYLVMEFVDGFSALNLLDQQGRLPIGDAVHVALNIARALEHAHTRNIVHRDIKPDNILITRAGVAKLSDLGLARRTDETSHLTATRQGFGTPWYMPYEQALNAKQADARSDIYALGATLYHLIAGEVPFPGANHLEVMEKKEQGDFPPASVHNPEVPPVLDQILDRMLARKPMDRYQTASELIVDLDRSNLSAAMPTFADPDLAREDPYMKACLTSAAQPTQPDTCLINSPGTGEEPGKTEEVWYLRRRDANGEWCRTTATTAQIVQQLRSGRLPIRVEASQQADGVFQTLSNFPEFRDIRPVNGRRKKAVRSPLEEPPPDQTRPSFDSPTRFPWLMVTGIAMTSVAAVFVVVLWWLLIRSS